MPERFGLSYVDAAGAPARPVMIHRAILGSLERFSAILLEHHDGALPAWLAPVQVAVIPIADAQADFAAEVVSALRAEGLRVEAMGGAMTLSRAMVDARNASAPLVAVIGRREAETLGVALRDRQGRRDDLPLGEAVAECVRRCAAPF